MNTKCDKEKFITKSKALYGEDAFDYTFVEYVNGYTEVILICKKHGKIEITPNKHLEIVGGCPHCSKEQRKKKSPMSNDDYKQLVVKKHGNEYDLSKVFYKGMREYVTATCPIHGDFDIIAYDLAHKRGCPTCGIEKRVELKRQNPKKCIEKKEKLTNEKFRKKGTEIFNGYYIYTKTDLKNRDEKGRVCIICPEHGEFWQAPSSHLKGHGCSKCGHIKGGITQSLTTEQYIEKANIVHNFKYIYTDTIYTGCYNDIDIICPIHGKFTQAAYAHLSGHGCRDCATEANSVLLMSNTEDFIKKSKLIHKNDDYSLVNYKGTKIPVTIICEKGHVYSQMPNKHLSGHGCPYCTNNISNQEKEIVKYLRKFDLDVETNNRKILSNSKEIDILIPSKNIAIEFDGLYWHNEFKKPDRNYHLNKTLECTKKGIRLIHIFEDEWIYKREIVESRLNAILGLNLTKIYARKCEVRGLDSKTTKNFLNANHLQGGINSSIKYGLYYNDELVSVMTFCKPRKNLGQSGKNVEYELLRFCNKLNTTVIGGANKLFTHFVKEHNPNVVISYADRRWNTGQVYENMGFDFTHFSEPNYFYIIDRQRYNRFNFRKDILVKQGFDKNKSEHEIMLERGIYRIYDCGCLCYKWINKN